MKFYIFILWLRSVGFYRFSNRGLSPLLKMNINGVKWYHKQTLSESFKVLFEADG